MNKNIKSLLAILLLLVGVALVLDLCLRFLTRDLISSEQVAKNNFYKLLRNVEDVGYESEYPNIEKVLEYLDTGLSLAKIQPYEKYNIFILESNSKREHYAFLYGPVELLESEDYQEYAKTCPSVEFVASFGCWDELKKKYVPFVRESTGEIASSGNWLCAGLLNSGYLSGDLPPVPGCIVTADKTKNEGDEIYYPRKLLPVVKTIYPNLEIPEDRIIDLNQSTISVKAIKRN